jgi:hypothetical protein
VLTETHLSGIEKIQVDGYEWYGYNRKQIHNKAKKGSGGVGILINNQLKDTFEIRIIDK